MASSFRFPSDGEKAWTGPRRAMAPIGSLDRPPAAVFSTDLKPQGAIRMAENRVTTQHGCYDSLANVLVVGASARAAAHSAWRAGMRPAAVDRYADVDLVSKAQALRPNDWESDASILRATLELPACPWLYLGPLENRPNLVNRISKDRLLWGCTSRVLQDVRDFGRLAETLQRRGIKVPDWSFSPVGLPGDGSWMIKPIRSGGGQGVRRWIGEGTEPGFYYQKYIPGMPCSALFIGREDGAEFVGATRQILGIPGSDYVYRGSIGPLPLHERTRRELERIGDALAVDLGLLGIFGVDFVAQGDHPWPVEVNPRYTASVEVLELATGRSLLSEHRQVFEASAWPVRYRPASGPRFVAKQILYARRALKVPSNHRWPEPIGEPWTVPRFADLPSPGTEIGANEPILTVFGSGADLQACLRQLRQRVEVADKQLEAWYIENPRIEQNQPPVRKGLRRLPEA